MPYASAEVSENIDERIEQYRASNPDRIEPRSDVIRDALDEFLPKDLDEEDGDVVQEGAA